MKVVHIASGDLWAGAEKQLLSLACALRSQAETDVYAVILNPGTLAERLIAAGIPTLVLDERRLDALSLLRALIAHLRELRPALVHTHRTKENILGGLAAAMVGALSLRTQHGGQEHPRSWHDLRRQVLYAADYLSGRLLQKKIIAVSSALGHELGELYGRDRVVTINNGIDPGPTPLPKSWHSSHAWSIGIVGRLVPVKRVDIFLQIAAQLAALTPARVSFRVIGDGPLRDTLRAQANQLKDRVDLTFCGHLDDAETAIAALDMLVICSDHEGLPMVALEAMKAGTIVVTHRIGGLPELLEGGCGVLCEQQEPSAFAVAINHLLGEPDTAVRTSRQARQRLEDHYSAAAMARQYRALYTTMTER